MASAIDNRIVSMTFDNKMFERDIQRSMDSIDRMDSKINALDGTKAFANLTAAAKRVDLSPISSAAYAVSNSFNAMQIAGMTVIQNLTNSFINFGRRLWNISFGQMKTGGWNRALNIQQAEFMLEGLGLDVAQIKQDALDAVDGTAYGFDEAARAAANFGASGLKAGDQMKNALLGVAGVAAMTGRDFSSISDIFGTIASNGRLMTMQLRQFSASGLNVSAALAKYFNKTEEQINDMVSKGKISFEEFSEAMYKTFGDHAKDANKTFTGSLSNVKAALSRIGAEFATPISNDFIPALNSLRVMINTVKTDLSPLINMFKDWSKIVSTVLKNSLDKIASSKTFFNVFHGLEHIFMGLITILYTVRKTFKEVFPEMSGFTDLFRRLTIYLMPSEKALEGFANILRVLFAVMKVVIDAFVIGSKVVGVFAAIVYHALGYLMALIGGLSDLMQPYLDWIKNNNVVQKGLEMVLGVVFQLIIHLYNLHSGMQALVQNDKFQAWASNFTSMAHNLMDFFKELASHVKIADVAIIAMVVSLAFLFEFIKQTLLKGLNAVMHIFTGFTRVLSELSNTIQSLGGTFRALTNVFNKMAFQFVADLIIEFAIAVGILTISLKALSTMDWNEIIKGGVAIAFLATILVAATTAFIKLNTIKDKDQKAPGMLLPFLSLAVALAILGSVVNKLGSMDLKQLTVGIVALGLMSSLFIIVSKLSETSAGIDTAGFISFGISMMLLTVGVKMLGNLSTDVLAKGLIAIAVLSLIAKILATSVSMTSKFNASLNGGLSRDFNKNGTAIMGGLIQFALSMLILSATLSHMAKAISKDPQAMEDALFVVGLLSALFLGVQKAQSMLAGDGINTNGFIKFAIAIGILTTCLTTLTLLAHIDDMALGEAIISIYGLTTAIIAIMAAQKWLDKGTIDSTGFLKFAGTLSLMTGSLTTLALISHFDDHALGRAVLVLYALGGAIVAFMLAQQKLGMTAIDPSGFIKFALTLSIMTGSLATLAMMKPESLARATFSLFELTGLIMAMMLASQKLDSIKSKGFISFGLALMAMSSAMAILVRGDVLTPENMTKALITVGGLMLFMFLYQKFAEQTSTIKATGMMYFATSILILSGAVAILSSLPVDKMLVSVGAIALLGLAIGEAAKLAKDLTILSGTAFTIIAGGLIALAGALWILGQAGDPGDIFMNAVTIGLLAVSLAGISKILKGTNILDMAGFAVIAGSIILLAGAFKILADVPWQQIAIVSGILAGLILVISLFGTFATGAIYGLLGISSVLVSLALTLVSFGLAVKMVSDAFMTFTTALHSMAELSEEDINTIINNMNTFITGLGSVCDNIVAMSPKFAMAALAIGAALSAAVGAIIIAISNYSILGMILFASLLVTSLPLLLEALEKIMDATGAWFEENSEKVYEFGRQIGHVLVDGILGACEGLAEAIYDKMFGRDVQESYQRWKEVGEQAGNVYKENMLKAMDMYNDGQYSAEMMIAGLQAGIENGYMTEEEVMEELAARGLQAYNDRLGIHSPATEFIKSSEFTIKGLIEGIKDNRWTFEEAMAGLAESGIDSFKSTMGNSDMLGSIFSAIGVGGASKNYRAIGLTWAGGKYAYERAGYDSIEAYVEAQESAARSSVYKGILGDILGELGLDINVEDLMNDVDSKIDTSGISGYSSEVGKATQVTDKLKDSISSALDIFTQFNSEVSMTGRDVLANFVSQLNGVNQWSKELQELSSKGLNANFLQELADQGPQAYAKIHALYSMTESELNLFNRMYAQKIGLEKNTANDIRKTFVQNGAITEKAAERFGKNTSDSVAKGIKDNSDEVGDALTETELKAIETANEELEKEKIDEEFIARFTDEVSSDSSKIALENAFTELGYASMEAFEKSLNYETAMANVISFRNSIADQISGALNLFDEVEEKDEISTTKILDNMEENLKRVGGWSYNLTKMSKMGFSEGLIEYLRQLGPESADKVDAFVKMTAEEMSIANRYFEESVKLPTKMADNIVSAYSKAGFNTSLGFTEGIDPYAAVDVMKNLGMTSLSALEESLGIESPSKKTYQDGIYTIQGFCNGLQDETAMKDVKNAVNTLSSIVFDGLQEKVKTLDYKGIFEEFVNKIKNNIIDSTVALKSSMFASTSSVFDNMYDSLSDTSGVESTFEDSTLSVVRDLANKMTSIDLGIDEANAYEPVIHPVWDMNDVYAGTSYITDALSKESFKISGTINGANATTRTGPSPDAIMITNAINNLANEQRAIRSDLSNIRSEMSNFDSRLNNIYVRLDGNALVGELVAPLDKAMGKKVITQKRGRL